MCQIPVDSTYSLEICHFNAPTVVSISHLSQLKLLKLA